MLSAAVAYMEGGGEKRYIKPIVRHFGETALADIDQGALDAAAAAIYPNVTPATRARCFYTPMSAVLHGALGDKCLRIKWPKGSKGKERKDFLWPEDAFAIIDAADAIDEEFGLYLLTLLYSGLRKSEGLKILAADTKPAEVAMWLRDSKNGDPRMIQLRTELAEQLVGHMERIGDRERLFRWKDGGYFKHMLLRCTMAVCGLDCPKRRPVPWHKPSFRLGFVGFHTFRHTWATWMRRYGGADVQGLAETKNWRDPRSAQRYAHVVAREEWARVEKLPSPGNIRGKAS